MSKGNLPAFPFNDIGGNCDTGMTYRQWLAGLAMQAFISRLDGQPYGTEEMKFVAEYSVKQADALIAALEAKGDE